MLRSITAAVLFAATMSACASTSGTTSMEESSMRSAAAGQSTSMTQGENVRLPDGGILRYVQVTQDSRCPPGVQCIRAGDADLEFAYYPAVWHTPTRITPNLPEAPTKPIGAWNLTVEQLTFGDAPKVTVRIDPQ